MGKLIINESEKNRILGLYNLNENTTQNVEACPVVTQNSTNIKDLQEIIANIKQKFPKEDPYTKLNSVMNTDKVNFTAQGIPQRIACEISLQLQRTNFTGKNIIIIDGNEKRRDHQLPIATPLAGPGQLTSRFPLFVLVNESQ